MKNNFLKLLLFGSVLLAVASCNTKSEAPLEEGTVVDSDQIRTEIQEMEDAFALASNTRDVESVVVYYADDAHSYPSDSAPLIGKDAIKEHIKKEMESMPKNTRVTFEVKDVFPSNDGIYLTEIGSYTVLDSTDAKVYSGHYMSLFEKRDGKYVCIRDMSSSDTPRKKAE